jgi:hypothetical protein
MVTSLGCTNLTLVKDCYDASFLGAVESCLVMLEIYAYSSVRAHVPDPEGHSVEWGEGEWRVFLREGEGSGVYLFWDDVKKRWWEGFEPCLSFPINDSTWCDYDILPNNCGATQSYRLYCSDALDIVTKSRLFSLGLWLLLNMAPQFLLAGLVLLLAQREGFIHLAAHFPELFLTPSISNIAFGSDEAIWCGEQKLSVIIKMKPRLCWINVVISAFGHMSSLYILFAHYSKADPYQERSYLEFLKSGFQTVEGQRSSEDSSFFPPYITLLCLVLSNVALALLLHLAACSPLAPLPRRGSPSQLGASHRKTLKKK